MHDWFAYLGMTVAGAFAALTLFIVAVKTILLFPRFHIGVPKAYCEARVT